MFSFPHQFACLADLPTIKVDGAVVAVILDAKRIEMTRDRFHKVDLSFAVRFLDSTFADALFIVEGENAVLAVDDGGNSFTFAVDIGDALFL
jgi:hypothetical protein